MSTIRNFGFMWERDKVDWGAPGRGSAATLKGRMLKNKHRVVDFSQQMGIYVLYDRFEQPVQIGQSKNILKQLRQHRRDHLRSRWTFFTWFGFYKVVAGRNELLIRESEHQATRNIALSQALSELEAILIQVLEPRLNRRGCNWGDTEEYLQVSLENADDNEDDEDTE